MSIEYGEYQIPKAPEGRHVYSVKRDKNTAESRKGAGVCLLLQRSDMSVEGDTSNPRAPEERNVYNKNSTSDLATVL